MADSKKAIELVSAQQYRKSRQDHLINTARDLENLSDNQEMREQMYKIRAAQIKANKLVSLDDKHGGSDGFDVQVKRKHDKKSPTKVKIELEILPKQDKT